MFKEYGNEQYRLSGKGIRIEIYHRIGLKDIGFVQNQVLTIRFGIKPKLQDLKEIFIDSENNKYISFLASTTGDFDLALIVVSSRHRAYQTWAFKLWLKLLEYRPKFNISILDQTSLGFMPITSSIINETDFEMHGLDELDKKIIMLLNEDSRTTNSAMAKKLGVPVETINYRIRKIDKSEVISRYTVILERPPTNYNMIYFTNYEPTPGMVDRLDDWLKFVLELDGKLPICNSFQYMAGLIGYYSGAGIGCFENKEIAIKNAVLAPQEIMKEDNLTVVSAKIEHVLIGSLPVRNIDTVKKLTEIKHTLDVLKNYLKV